MKGMKCHYQDSGLQVMYSYPKPPKYEVGVFHPIKVMSN